MKYSNSDDPPVPVAEVNLKKINSPERSRSLEMVLDTGADISLLPRSVLEEIGIKPSGKKFLLVGFDGSTIESEIYVLQVILLGKRFEGAYSAIDEPIGIIGRDILNQLVLLLDGPQLQWSEVTS
jgi:predicted aspartyl protease